ncbi:MAG: hypothetical protein U1D30_18890 [Planctomycetota bacterium]
MTLRGHRLWIVTFLALTRTLAASAQSPQGAKEPRQASASVFKKNAEPARLRGADRTEVLLANVVEWRNPSTRQSRSDRRFPLRVELRGGDFLLAEVLEVQSDSVKVDSAIGVRELPRQRMARMVNDLAGTPVLSDSFDALSEIWRTRGTPGVSSIRFISSPSSLELNRPGSELSWSASTPLDAGSLSVFFYDPGTVHVGLQWGISLRFGVADPQIVRFEGGWTKSNYFVEIPPTLAGPAVPLARSQGWHRLQVSFGPHRLLVALDEAALVSSFHRGLELPLTQVEVSVREESKNRKENGEPAEAAAIWLDDLLLTETFTQSSPILRDPDQATVIDRVGDQWMGELLASRGPELSLRLAAGNVESFSWTDIQRFEFPDSDVGDSKTLRDRDLWNGEIGRLGFDGGSLLVELVTADEKQWNLRHPQLGTIMLPVDTVRTWVPVVQGWRRTLYPRHFHLGRKLVSEFVRPVPDGEGMKLEFDLDAADGETALRLWVAGMEGTGPRAPFASKLLAGHLVSELWINGQKVDTLNRYVEDRSTEPVAIRVPLPRGVFRSGSNVVEIRQTPDPQSGFFDDLEISQLTIEDNRSSKEVPSRE